MEPNQIEIEAEGLVRDLSNELFTPQPRECLLCFVDRQVSEFGCDGTHRFAAHFRDMTAPRATALLRTLGGLGAFCDCEVALNAYWPEASLWSRGYWHQFADGREEYREARPPDRMPPCRGVRRGSTPPCALWERRRGGFFGRY